MILVETNAAMCSITRPNLYFIAIPLNEDSFQLIFVDIQANIFQGYKHSDSMPSLQTLNLV